MIHLYRATYQPATRYHIELGEGGIGIRHRARTQLPTVCCSRKRYARNLRAQVYYDGVYFSCRDGRGCKKKMSSA